MRLNDIIQAIEPGEIIGFQDVPVNRVACHPDQVVGEDTLFVCMDEYLEYNLWQTWRTHLERLPELGLSAIVAPREVPGLKVPQLVTREPRKALGRAARLLNGSPDADMQVFGVTGTNGKTTTTRLLAHLLSELGLPAASLGTLGIRFPGKIDQPGTYTTPLAPQMYAHLRAIRQMGAKAVSMEVSSHGLALDRIEGLTFDGAVLTNIERDHLDFHGTPEAYAEAKRRLFAKVRKGGVCVLSRDCPQFDAFVDACSERVITFGKGGSGADVELVESTFQPSGSSFRIETRGETLDLETQLVGHFQVENILAAVTLLWGSGYPVDRLGEALSSFPPVAGRMEQIPMKNGATAIVDYAHNPDGLKNLLRASRGICRGNLHLVVGCGGDRDRGKRPMMGRLAADLADFSWITSDNPRTEDPDAIIRDVLEGIPAGQSGIHVEADRARAIAAAYAATGPEDVLVVAGKGHEDYQIIGLKKYHFSDQEILRGL